jgi:adenylate kinase
VIEFDVDEAALVNRLAGRFTCQQCGASYHERDNRPKVDGVCDVCGACEFICRADDRPETVKARLGVYHRQTAPILPYYRERGILNRVDGMAEINSVTRAIANILG